MRKFLPLFLFVSSLSLSSLVMAQDTVDAAVAVASEAIVAAAAPAVEAVAAAAAAPALDSGDTA